MSKRLRCRHVIAVFCVYAALIAVGMGLVSLAKPLSFLGMGSRQRALLVVGVGAVAVAVGMTLPAAEVRVAAPRTLLDHFVPVYQFKEFHSIRVVASRDQVYRAIQQTTAGEIFLFRTLTWIRRLGRAGSDGILNAPENRPLLDVATSTSFLKLAEEPGHEFVVGTLVIAPAGFRPKPDPTPEDFKSLQQPGFALAAMNFRVEEAGPGACTVTTETRVYATDAAVRRKFARYWRVIYPGSALIRRMWLRAIKTRAEAASPATVTSR
jgi:hypothetical protein